MLGPQPRAGCTLHAWQVPAPSPRLRTVGSRAVPITRRTVSEGPRRRTEKTEAQRLSKVGALRTTYGRPG